MSGGPPYQEPYEELILEKLRYAAQQAISGQMMRHLALDTRYDWMLDRMVVRLHAEVMADKVCVDTVDVPVTGRLRTDEVPQSVMVEIPNGFWRRLLRRPTRKRWLPVVGNAAYTGDADQVRVQGTAKVRAEYFRTFPEATIQYPPELGQVRMLVQREGPTSWMPDAWGSATDGSA